jgi:acetyltransferase
MGHLKSIFSPQSVAVIGASGAPAKVGAIALRNLLSAGFAGPIYPVNNCHATVQGLLAYSSVRELPQAVDLAVVCTPAATIPELVRECGEHGTGGMIILSAGFREMGAEGRAAEQAVRDEARRFPKMRIIGPNCLGAIVPGARLNASFAAAMPSAGRVAFVSQSGALCTAVLDWAIDHSLGFSHFVSIGNMLDVNFADMLDYLAMDPMTDSVVLYIESIVDARAFMSAARACARIKPIIAYKAGRFAESAQAAASHTGAMAGVDSVYQAAFERAGIVRVWDVNDLFACAELLAKGPRVRGPRLAIVTNAGGPGVVACDALLARHGTLAQLTPETIARLDDLLPAAWSHANPVDVLGDASPERFAQALGAVSQDPGVDAALAILTPQAMTGPTATAAAVAEVAKSSPVPIIASWMGSRAVREGIDLLERHGVPTIATPGEAVAGFMDLVCHARNLESLYETPREIPLELTADRRSLRAALVKRLETPRAILDEADAKAFLQAYGIQVTEPLPAHSADEAVSLARRTGFPVVLKVVSPQITHKTDVGGVALNLLDDAQVRAAYDRMISEVIRKSPEAVVESISVQPMLVRPSGIELIVGINKDPVFGPVIMVGLGGIAAELFEDRALGLPPLDERSALRMLESLRAWPLISGFRGRAPIASTSRLVELLLRMSLMASDFPEIKELDANPVLAHGDEIVALDARLVIDRDELTRPSDRVRYGHLAIRPYPEEIEEEARLNDGTAVLLRPIKAEDEPVWRALLRESSRESLWARFRHTFKVDSHEAAVRFCFVDYDREFTVVAESRDAAPRRLLAVARVVSERESDRAEFAAFVGDAWQGRGLGNMLMAYCLEHLDRARVHTVYADTRRDNTRMIRVFERYGFKLEASPDPGLLRATKTL